MLVVLIFRQRERERERERAQAVPVASFHMVGDCQREGFQSLCSLHAAVREKARVGVSITWPECLCMNRDEWHLSRLRATAGWIRHFSYRCEMQSQLGF